MIKKCVGLCLEVEKKFFYCLGSVSFKKGRSLTICIKITVIGYFLLESAVIAFFSLFSCHTAILGYCMLAKSFAFSRVYKYKFKLSSL